MFTLDTNILIYFSEGDSVVTSFLLDKIKKDVGLLIPTIVVVELFSYPVSAEQHALLSPVFSELRIIPLDMDIALRAAELRKTHRMKLGDSIVAASALTSHSVLVTRNVKDFENIHQLEIHSL